MKIQYVLTLLASAFAIVSATDSVSTDKLCYHVGEDIEASFRVQHPDHRDWVAIYEADADFHDLGRTLLWLNTCGDQHCSFSVSSGTLTFGSGDPEEGSRAHFPLPAGHYKAVLARDSHIPYDGLAESEVFTISDTSCSPNTIIDVLEDKGNFHTLLAALAVTGLDVAIRNAVGPFTLFAPNDHAFDLLGDHTIAFLLDNLDILADILLYHVVAGKLLSSHLEDGSITTLNDDDIHVDVRSSGSIVINGNTLVLHRDLLASNGVVQEINKVLEPPSEVSVNKSCYHVGEDIEASFRVGIPRPQDWVAIYEGDADLHDLASRPLLWLFTCGDQHCSFSVSSGTLTFGSGHPDESSRGHFPLPAGHYKAILTRNLHLPYEALAVSHVFSINTSSHPCP